MSMVSVRSTSGTYVFDVTFKETHTFENVITQHPVQTGASINDHVYQQPIVFTWDVGASDCLASVVNGQFATASSRAVSAFNVLRTLWQTAEALTVTTTYGQYTNMIIRSFNATKDKTLMNAMRATVTFQQIIVTDAVTISASQKQSSTPQTTNSTVTGTIPTNPNNSYKTLTIPQNEYSNTKVTYNGSIMTLAQYFQKYSTSQAKFTGGTTISSPGTSASGTKQYQITPIINSSVTSNSTFNVNGVVMFYSNFISKYSG